MERDVAWNKYDEADDEALEELAAEYIGFISQNKTERECAACRHRAWPRRLATRPLDEAVREGRALAAGRQGVGGRAWQGAHFSAGGLAALRCRA